MSDFLLELLSEEIPARMQVQAREELARLFRREMEAAGVELGPLTVWSTPRRLALIARGLPERTQPQSEEIKGPPVGAPDSALDGFCRKNKVTREELEQREVKGRMTWFAVRRSEGRAIEDILTSAIEAILRDFSWPKSMRWGPASISSASLRWVRPLSAILALLDDRPLEGEVAGFALSNKTRGHRFHAPGPIEIARVDDYQEALRAARVIVDHEERAAIIREGARKAAAGVGLRLVEDDGLVIENTGLTEWPVPLLGRFDERFLEVPPEVIQLTARVNQKYFVCEDSRGKLANAFVCTANIDAVDPQVVVEGNRKVLAARLADARFFWELDQKTPLEEHAKKLARITFHEKLGTLADKVERVARLARWLCEEGVVKADPDLAEQAARLAKADLVTEMVGEFPELQGIMGGYYAERQGLPREVCDAIRDHYKPVGQGDEVPTAPVTVAVSLADKLDTIREFYRIGEKPTGSKDPFALRRCAIGNAQLAVTNLLPMKLVRAMVSDFPEGVRELVERAVIQEEGVDTDAIIKAFESFDKKWQKSFNKLSVALHSYKSNFSKIEFPNIRLSEIVIPSINTTASDELAKVGGVLQANTAAISESLQFVVDRLKVQQREAGVRHDLIDAVFALGDEDDLVRLLARVKALQGFIETDDGANLLAAYKRAANILKKEGFDAPHGAQKLSYAPEAAEAALIEALDAAEPKARAAIEAEDFEGAMAALASLRAPIDRFFDEVTVNDSDAQKRAARLALLARFRDAVHRVADFGRIEG